jgi:uncharacterized membrane protein
MESSFLTMDRLRARDFTDAMTIGDHTQQTTQTRSQLRGAALVVATMATGLMAGVFGLYANAIMPGLRTTDDRTFVGAFQSIDEAITNPLFLTTFVGALVIIGVAALLHLGEGGRPVLPWTVAAFVLYLAVFLVTVRVNVPVNDEIKAAGDPDRIADLAAVRERFDETRWVRWNIVRTVMATAAFGCLTWALVLHGRTLTRLDRGGSPGGSRG